MKLSLELILEQITTASLPLVSLADTVTSGFHGLTLFSSGTPPQDPELLYMGQITDILTLEPEQTEDFVFVLFGAPENFKKAQQRHRCTMLYFIQEDDMAKYFNLFQDLFSRFHRWDQEVDRLIQEKAGLQEILDVTEPLLENPVYLWDATYRIQAFTQSIKADQPILQEYREGGRVPHRLLNQMTRLRDSPMYNTEHYTTIRLHHPPNMGNMPYALRMFLAGQQTVLVMVCYFANTSPTMGRLELLTLLSEKLEHFVRDNYPKSQFKTLLYEPFLIELIEGTLQTEEEIQERLRLIHLPYQSKYRIYYIASSTYTASLISYLRHNCKTLLPYAKVIQYNRGILMLDLEEKEKLDSEEAINGFLSGQNALTRINAVAGLSSAFYNLSQTRVAYLQAMAAFELGQALHPGKSVYYYRDYYLYHILDICSKYPEIDLDQLYFSRLDVLEECDQSAKNDNMMLLEVYLRNNRNITNTAREMFLHRNSVIYRLDRITQILHVPLEDPDVQMRLLISLHIRRLLQIRGKD